MIQASLPSLEKPKADHFLPLEPRDLSVETQPKVFTSVNASPAALQDVMLSGTSAPQALEDALNTTLSPHGKPGRAGSH